MNVNEIKNKINICALDKDTEGYEVNQKQLGSSLRIYFEYDERSFHVEENSQSDMFFDWNYINYNESLYLIDHINNILNVNNNLVIAQINALTFLKQSLNKISEKLKPHCVKLEEEKESLEKQVKNLKHEINHKDYINNNLYEVSYIITKNENYLIKIGNHVAYYDQYGNMLRDCTYENFDDDFDNDEWSWARDNFKGDVIDGMPDFIKNDNVEGKN